MPDSGSWLPPKMVLGWVESRCCGGAGELVTLGWTDGNSSRERERERFGMDDLCMGWATVKAKWDSV